MQKLSSFGIYFGSDLIGKCEELHFDFDTIGTRTQTLYEIEHFKMLLLLTN